VRSGIALRPADLDWGLLAGGGLLAGIGFTMALFVANLAFSSSLIDSAKLGIFLASVVSAVAGLALLAWLPARGSHPEWLAVDDECRQPGTPSRGAAREGSAGPS